jgi:hypothetical protein
MIQGNAIGECFVHDFYKGAKGVKMTRSTRILASGVKGTKEME